MKIGAMNHPQRDTYEEIKFILESGFDFLDLTIEPGKNSYAEDIDTKKIKSILKDRQIKVIGHTPWDLPWSSPYSKIRDAAVDEFKKCLKVFSELSVKLVNVHPFTPSDVSDPNEILMQNIEGIKKCTAEAKKLGIILMMENTKSLFNELEVIERILEEIPGLMLHWDVGHANLGNEGEKKTQAAFEMFGSKIAHIHFSDNSGGDDQHLPLGAGNINWPFIINILLKNKYDKTITLEVHSQDLSLLLFSRDKLKYIVKKVSEENKK